MVSAFLVFFLLNFFVIRIFLSAFSHPHPPSAGIRSAFYRHPIKEARWVEVGQFRVWKNVWTSTGANLRKTRAFLWGVGGGDLLRCSERKSVWPRYHGSKISGGVCSFSIPEPLGLICNGLWGREWSLLRFSQTRAASFPVVLGDFGCDVPCQNT